DCLQIVELSLVVKQLLSQAFLQDLVGLGKALAAGERINVEGDVFLRHAPHDTADKPAPGEDIELGEFFRRLDRVAQWQYMPDDADLHALGSHDEGGGQDRTRGVDVEVGKMVLVDQGAIKAQVFAESPLIEVLLVRLG